MRRRPRRAFTLSLDVLNAALLGRCSWVELWGSEGHARQAWEVLRHERWGEAGQYRLDDPYDRCLCLECAGWDSSLRLESGVTQV